jgi:hypothetical protein
MSSYKNLAFFTHWWRRDQSGYCVIVMTSKALNNCIWWPSSSSSSLCLSLAEVCSCYFWPPRAKKKIIAHILSSAFFRRPAVITSVWIVCLSSSSWIDVSPVGHLLSLSLPRHRDMTNQCSQTLQLFACPNNFSLPPYSTPFPLFKAPTTFGRVGCKFDYAMSFGPQLNTPP